ncbi:MAG: alpha/beta fold hydrolase [Roseiflexaceae bacterium]|nr:alpha/beta fold hydrolase [Roseiflexaceae bacterium]
MALYTIDDQTIYLEETGPENAPYAFLVHGWASSSYTWKPILPVLSCRYRCVAIDLPGFGRSPAPTHPPTITGYADLVARLIEHFSPDQPVALFGHSMGGQISTALALRYPLLVERMVLLNPALSGRLSTRVNLLIGPHVLAERFPPLEWLLHLLAKTPIDYTDYLLRPSNFAERAQVLEEDYQRIRADARRPGQGRMRAACFQAMRQGDLRGKLSMVEPPALVIWGAEDNIVPLRDAGAVAAEWPTADLRIIPNAGHWPQFEQPDATLRHIALFLGLPPAGVALPADLRDIGELRAIAQFLNNSEIGGHLNETQRLRVASLLQQRVLAPRERLAAAGERSHEMYIVQDGLLEVWLDPVHVGGARQPPVRIAFMQSGQVAGELGLLEDTERSAELRAGDQPTTVLVLTREALNTLAEDDPALGMRLMQNLAVSLGRRLRRQNWLAQRLERRALQGGSVTRVLE